MSGRDAMLADIRRRLGAAPGDGRAEAVAARLARPPRGPVPARTRLAGPALLEEFCARAQAAAATVERLADAALVPGAIAAWLAGRNLAAEVRVAADPWLACLPWGRHPALTTAWGSPDADTRVGVTTALAGIAETGTVLTASGRNHPHSLALLPDVHIVVLPSSRVVACYEEAFDRVRGRGAPLPRAVSLITGPSRTGDIEQTLVMEAHGPGRVHVLLVEDAPPTPRGNGA